MTRRKETPVDRDAGIAALLAADTRWITVVGKASVFQATEVLRTTLDENLAMIADTIEHLRRAEREVIFDAEHFFDGWKANGQYALQTLRAAAAAGARMIVLCDTNGGACPRKWPPARGPRSKCSASPSASTATTTAAWRRPTRWPPSTRARSRCKGPSTASASGAATPI